MDLYCKTVHLWGQQVNAGGKVIDIPLGGLVTGLDDETAKRLLGDSSGWELRRASMSAAQASKSVATAGAVVATKPVTAPSSTPAPEPEALDLMKTAEPAITRTRRRGVEEK